MEVQNLNKKCSLKTHEENKAIYYCQKCSIYMCNKCENLHSQLFPNHDKNKVDDNFNEIFTGICKEENHKDNLLFFCRSHNVLCCAACLSKIKKRGNAQHADCNVCDIDDMKDEKKNKLKENIKYLENISNSFETNIEDLKKIMKK